MKAGVFLTGFALFWTAIVGAFDVLTFGSMGRQLLALNYSSTEGRIVSSEVTQHSGGEGGTTYGVKVEYEYAVNGQTYSSERYRYGQWSTSDSAWAHATVAALPAGGATKVFYNPRNPADALLRPGIDGGQLFMVLFLTPFNLVMLACLGVPIALLWRKYFQREWNGARVRSKLGRLRVHLPRYSPLMWAVAVLGISTFTLTFILGFSFQMNPPLSVMIWVWAGVLLATLGAFFWQWFGGTSGRNDLVIDTKAGTLALPITFGRKESRTVKFSEVQAVEIDQVEHRNSEGKDTYSYAPTLRLRNAELGNLKLAEWHDEARANVFATWLRKQTKLDAPAKKTEVTS